MIDYWSKCKWGIAGQSPSCLLKTCKLHQKLCIEKCKDWEDEKKNE